MSMHERIIADMRKVAEREDQEKAMGPWKPLDTLSIQVGGTHYKNQAIQPIEYILANNLDYIQGNIIKYITRYKHKGGIQDLEKIKHYVDFAIENIRRKEIGRLSTKDTCACTDNPRPQNTIHRSACCTPEADSGNTLIRN